MPSRPAVIFHAEISTPDRGACRRLVLLLFRIETKLRLRSASRGSAALQSSLPSACRCCSSTLLKDERFFLIFSSTRGGRTLAKPARARLRRAGRLTLVMTCCRLSHSSGYVFRKRTRFSPRKILRVFALAATTPESFQAFRSSARRFGIRCFRLALESLGETLFQLVLSRIFMARLSSSFYRNGSQFIANVVRLRCSDITVDRWNK